MIEKEVTVEKLAEMVQGRVLGDGARLISGFAPLDSADLSEITFLAKAKDKALLSGCKAGAVIVPKKIYGDDSLGSGGDWSAIEVADPYLAVAIIHSFFVEKPFVAKGVHPKAHVEESCSVSDLVTIAPLAVLGERVTVGERVEIKAGAVIGDDVVIGNDTTIHANVTIYEGTKIGSRVSVHSGTVLGSDGYGYAANEQGVHIKRPQVGIVQIEDDVEIGANCCIDRAAYGVTLIKSGVKIDNLVQVAHNVTVGENSLLVAQVGIAGSTTLGRNVVLGGQSAISGHLHIGDQVMVAARGGVHSDLAKGSVVGGAPAIPIRKWAKCCAIYNNLPELRATIKKNTETIKELSSAPESR